MATSFCHPTPIPFTYSTDVYEPAEDSYLMMDAIERDINRLNYVQIVVEIGCGSGAISAFLLSLLRSKNDPQQSTSTSPFHSTTHPSGTSHRSDNHPSTTTNSTSPTTTSSTNRRWNVPFIMCVDILNSACQSAQQTVGYNYLLKERSSTSRHNYNSIGHVECNDVTIQPKSFLDFSPIDAVQMNLFVSIQKKKLFDLILFNPPYVPSDSALVGANGPDAAWAGGQQGREVIDRFILVAQDYLTDTGIIYLLVERQNDPADVCKRMEERGLRGVEIISRKARNEMLYVYRFEHIESHSTHE